MRRDRESRRFIKPIEVILILVLAGCCLLLLLWQNRTFGLKEAVKAEIRYQGKLVMTLALTEEENRTFQLEENPKAGFQVEDHRIRFWETQCPDKVCERAGYLSHSGQTAVCMPNQVTLQIIGGADDSLDGVVD